jgi:hypothetical protein
MTTDVTTLPDGTSAELAAGWVYGWVPGAPAYQFKIPISDVAALAGTQGLWKKPVRAASVANVNTASPGSAIDGVTLAVSDRVLLKDQSTASQNGIWTWNGAAVAMTRTTDADEGPELVNAALAVSEGTVNADTIFQCTTNAPISVGSTALAFVQTAASARNRSLMPTILGQALTTSEVFFACTPPVGETWTFPANFTGASGKKLSGGANPAASYAIDVSKNGSSVGTITISTSGVVSFATAGGTSFTLVGGTDELRLVGPAGVDTAVGYAFAIPFTY